MITFCTCGSKKWSWIEFDARGIYLCRVCEDCEKRKLGVYRDEVLINPAYEVDEPIEPEE